MTAPDLTLIKITVMTIRFAENPLVPTNARLPFLRVCGLDGEAALFRPVCKVDQLDIYVTENTEVSLVFLVEGHRDAVSEETEERLAQIVSGALIGLGISCHPDFMQTMIPSDSFMNKADYLEANKKDPNKQYIWDD